VGGDAGDHHVRVGEVEHQGGEGVGLPDALRGGGPHDPAPAAHPEVLVDVALEARAAGRLHDLGPAQPETKPLDRLPHLALPAEQDRGRDPLLHEEARGAQDGLARPLREDDAELALPGAQDHPPKIEVEAWKVLRVPVDEEGREIEVA
jgi:hypothetical protein